MRMNNEHASTKTEIISNLFELTIIFAHYIIRPNFRTINSVLRPTIIVLLSKNKYL